MDGKIKKGLSDLFFITGTGIITLFTGMMIGSVGRVEQSYVVDITLVYIIFTLTTIPFVLGYWSGRFYQGVN